MNDRLNKNPELRDIISYASVTTNILFSLCKAFSDRIEFEFEENAMELETELCKILITEWKLPPTIPCLESVNLAMNTRIKDIRSETMKVMSINGKDKIIELPEYFYLEFLSAVGVACMAFDMLFKTKKHWALCFDELELSPKWLYKNLMTVLRSTDETLIFKLSTSPIPDFLGDTSALPRQDFHIIRLWNQNKTEKRHFCKRLAISLIERQIGQKINPEDLFGKSIFSSEYPKEEYVRNSNTWKMIKEVAEWDDGLKSTLIRNGISPDDPYIIDSKLRDQVLRKIKPIVIMRKEFSNRNVLGTITGRSRKIATIYYGEEVIYDISDGNPRCLIGILNDLLEYKTKRFDGKWQVLNNRQATVLQKASNQFCAMVSSLPDSSCLLNGKLFELYKLLKHVGQYVFKNIVMDEFKLDPISNFSIDENFPEVLYPLLKIAVYNGAIVYLDPISSTYESQLKGKAFRLSYLFAPSWKLPLRRYETVSLSRCLEHYTPYKAFRYEEMQGGGKKSQEDQPELPLEY